MSLVEIVLGGSGHRSGALEQIPTTRTDDARPTVEIVECRRVRGRQCAGQKDDHHAGADAVGEDARDLTHDRVACNFARIHPYGRQQHEDADEHERDHVAEAEIPQADLEPAPAILERLRRQLSRVDGQI